MLVVECTTPVLTPLMKKDTKFKGWMNMSTIVLHSLTEDYIKSYHIRLKAKRKGQLTLHGKPSLQEDKKSASHLSCVTSRKNPVQSCYI